MLIIIHLMGNHGNYHDRYPDEFNKYSGDIGTYDNSILYNDYPEMVFKPILKE